MRTCVVFFVKSVCLNQQPFCFVLFSFVGGSWGPWLPDRLWAYSIFFIIHISLAANGRWEILGASFQFLWLLVHFYCVGGPSVSCYPDKRCKFPGHFPQSPASLLSFLASFYAPACVFCCVFNEMFIAMYFYSRPQLLLIEWRGPIGLAWLLTLRCDVFFVWKEPHV